MSHLDRTLAGARAASAKDETVILDGASLTISQVAAIARQNANVAVTKSFAVWQRIRDSIQTLDSHLESRGVIYGVNTACGGNADLRTCSYEKLQSAFFQHHQTGILPETMPPKASGRRRPQGLSLSKEVVRAVVTVRCNSLLRGHSAIRMDIIERLVEAVSRGATPLIPSRGSISASGDLGPLAYIGGFLEGNPDTYVRMDLDGMAGELVSAREAQELLALDPIKLRPKEGLAIMNGTSASAALAALVLHDGHNLAVLCQVLTAMTAEAMLAKASNYDEFLSRVRPHPGQGEVASNVSRFLRGSKLCTDEGVAQRGLAQDRYALRTAPQWIGPQLEDLSSADAQISTELNSTTDNPIVDAASDRLHHGGNFQAASVTSAMEKTRGALVMLGRLLLAQSGELTNPDLNNGLPANLVADDPSLSFTGKGVDINMAAYYSELAFLANSVASHVQTAEMNNQSVNSLALVAARMTEKAAEIVSMMVAGLLFLACQALDLRARDEDFLRQAREAVFGEFVSTFKPHLRHEDAVAQSFAVLWSSLSWLWRTTNRLDPSDRCRKAALESVAHLLDSPEFRPSLSHVSLLVMQSWKDQLQATLASTYQSSIARFHRSQSTAGYLGAMSARMHNFVRTELALPFHPGLQHHPALTSPDADQTPRRTIGTYVTRLYDAVRDNSILQPVVRWSDDDGAA